MLKTAVAKRTAVTVDDRRVVYMAVKARKPRELVAVPNEQFIRNMLKDRMGWPRNEPAPEQVKAVAKEMALAFHKAAMAPVLAAQKTVAADVVGGPVPAQ